MRADILRAWRPTGIYQQVLLLPMATPCLLTPTALELALVRIFPTPAKSRKRIVLLLASFLTASMGGSYPGKVGSSPVLQVPPVRDSSPYHGTTPLGLADTTH